MSPAIVGAHDNLVPSSSSLPSKEPGASKLLGPLGTPEEGAPGCKASGSISVPDYCLRTCAACPGAVGSREPDAWRGAGELGPLAPTSIILDGKPAHPDPAGRTSDDQGGEVSGMSLEWDSQVQPGPQEPGPRGFVYIGEWLGLATIPEKDRPCKSFPKCHVISSTAPVITITIC